LCYSDVIICKGLTSKVSEKSMISSGWDALKFWGEGAVRVEPLAGGVANDVWSVSIDGSLAVGRLGTRSDADLSWEAELLLFLEFLQVMEDCLLTG
jgi:hypothetical protein